MASPVSIATLFEKSQHALLVLDEAGNCLDANELVLELSGYAIEDLEGKPALSFVVSGPLGPDADAEAVAKGLSFASSGGLTGVRFLAKNGEQIPIEFTVSHTTYNAKRAYVLSLVDIRERAEMVSELSATLEILPTMPSIERQVLRTNGRLELCNKITYLIVESGKHRLAWIGQAFPDKRVGLVSIAGELPDHPEKIEIRWDDSPLGNGAIGQAIKHKKAVAHSRLNFDHPSYYWWEHLRRYGEISTIALPILWPGDEVWGVLVIYASRPDAFGPEEINVLEEVTEDISVGFNLIQQKIEANEMSLKLRNLQLDRESRVRSLTGIVHDLRHPLTSIKLYLDLLQRGKAEHHAKYYKTLHSEIDRLHAQVDELSTYTRLRLSEEIPQEREVDLSALLKSLLLEREPLATEMQLTLVDEITESLPAVPGDANLLAKALVNLLANAFHYTRTGGRITVRAKPTLQVGKLGVEIKIADTGIGIPSSELNQIFTRFERGAQARQLGQGGTGLGLSICEEIIKQHNGHIEVKSQVGLGTQVILWLPANKIDVSLY